MSEFKIGDLVSANTDIHRSKIHKFMIILKIHPREYTNYYFTLRSNGTMGLYWHDELDLHEKI